MIKKKSKFAIIIIVINDIVDRFELILSVERYHDAVNNTLRCTKETKTTSIDVISLQVVLEKLKMYPRSFKKNLLLVTNINS